MKKLLGIVVLGLLWCNTSFAETIELDQGIKVNIPKGYEYLQFDQIEFMRANFEGLKLSESEIDEIVNEMKLLLGMNGSETSTLIGKKGYAKGYGSFINHTMSGNAPESWSGFSKFEKKCGNKQTEKSMMDCLIKFFKMDPIIQIDVGNDTNEDLKELTLLINEINTTDTKDIKDLNKSSEKIKKTFSNMYQNEINLKIVKIKNKKWGFEIFGEDIMMGFKAKRIGYMFMHNEHAFIIQGFCMSKTTCKNIKKLNNQIIEPYLSKLEEKTETKAKPEKKETKKTIKKKKEPSQTQEVAEKKVVWEVFALGGNSAGLDDVLMNYWTKKSFIIKQLTTDPYDSFMIAVNDMLDKCPKYNCKITQIKYYEPNDPSKNQKIVGSRNTGIKIEDVKVSWNGIDNKDTQITKKETKKTDSKLRKAKDECKELGFTKGTEKFGDCVMKMLSM